jgi:hypothetical protein
MSEVVPEPVRIAVMQPTYLPWLGYFDLMDQVDVFVLLDDVQFSRQSWQQRNRVKGASGLVWLTVPVLHKGRHGQRIDETRVSDPRFSRKHVRTLETEYAKAPYADEHLPAIRQLFAQGEPWESLVELNTAVIGWLAEALGIETRVTRASSLSTRGERRYHVPDICRALGGTHYLSPLGAADYLLGELSSYEEQDLVVAFQNYEHPTYRQLHGEFVPFASAVDLLLNEGPAGLEIIRSGRRAAISPEALDRGEGGASG